MHLTASRLRACSRVRMAALLGTASLATIATVNAWGQTPAPNPQAPAVAQNSDQIPENVLITGSLIGGTAAVGVPVSNLRAQDFAETGQLTLADILKSVPALDIDAQASTT